MRFVEPGSSGLTGYRISAMMFFEPGKIWGVVPQALSNCGSKPMLAGVFYALGAEPENVQTCEFDFMPFAAQKVEAIF